MPTSLQPRFFAAPSQFRAWLERNHERAAELYVGYYKTSTGKPSMAWPQSVDEALCFGWIDGVRKSIDEESYMIRFTPRRPGKSIWSAVNLKRVPELISEGRMTAAGLRAYESRRPADAKRYSFEQDVVAFTADLEKAFRKNRKAWAWFKKQAPSYRKAATWWVISAKLEATQKRRLTTLIDDSAAGVRIALLRRP
jgi:uncharacterized protein YdeI (YjbR/CyaY-like superfamily)